MPIPAALSSPRAAIMTVFAGFGFAVGALAGAAPVVTRASGLSDFALGAGITCFSLASVTALSLGSTLGRFASNRSVLLVTLPLVATTLLATLLASSPALFLIAYTALGLALGCTDLFMNAEGTAIEMDVGRPVFTAFHGSVSSALMVMALAASFVSTRFGTTATWLVAAPVFAVAWWLVARNLKPRQQVLGRSGRVPALPHRGLLALLGVMVGLSISAETAAIMWSAKLLNAQAPDLAAIAGLGAAFFGLCNAIVRFLGDALRARLGDIPLMIGSILVAMAGFVLLGLSPGFAWSVAGFALVGFGTAPLFPCVMTQAAALAPENKAGAISFISLLAGGPRIAAPWAFGAIVTATSIGFAFGLFAAAMAVALLLVVMVQNLRYSTANSRSGA